MPGTILCGDALEVLKTLPDGSVNCAVTSPPYFRLRKNSPSGDPGELGQEAHPQAYIDRLTAIFAEVRRVLRDDGIAWVVIGDCTAKRAYSDLGIKPGDLIGIPFMLAFALRRDGWWLKRDIIFAKKNPVPNPGRTQPTPSHEYVFLLAKSRRYSYDPEAMQEPATCTAPGRAIRFGGTKYPGNVPNATYSGRVYVPTGFRNKRDVWFLAPASGGGHTAPFPPALVEPCILAGCPPGGMVLDPFFGGGTVGVVVEKVGGDRSYIGIEINPDYCEDARRRIATSA